MDIMIKDRDKYFIKMARMKMKNGNYIKESEMMCELCGYCYLTRKKDEEIDRACPTCHRRKIEDYDKDKYDKWISEGKFQ